MDQITQMLFWISNSLLIPNILMLLILFVRSLMLLGSFYNSFMLKRKTALLLKDRAEQSIESVQEVLPQFGGKNASLFGTYLTELMKRESPDEDYVNYLLNKFENQAEKELNLPRMLTKVGPVLGLIGTLISMSPALVGLSGGDITGMAYNMQIVFATTVVGLVISLIGLVITQYKQRWFASDLNNLEFIASLLLKAKK